ncbi:MAG: sugar phosphate isomerase/epimerase [Firmicutes bacterium]|nr:sugar phosphate isomerase/epimerase [Bacillota bacterium]
MSLPVALQLYSIRDEMAKDFAGTLKLVKEMGYDGVEFAGFGGHDVPEVKKMLEDSGLVAISGHVPYEAFLQDAQKVFADYKALGCKYVAIPWLDAKMAPGGEDFKATLEKIHEIGKAANAAGITLLYHNHEFEFKKVDGVYGLDMLYDSVPACCLATQIDTCWVKVAKLDPADYVRKYKGRAPVVHLKDFIMEGDVTGGMYELIGKDEDEEIKKDGFEFRPVGQGMQDIPSILDACLHAGTEWVVVEQDMSPTCTPLEAAKASREYLKSLGW